MSRSQWTTCHNNVLPYLFSISTPEGSGTGFFVAFNQRKTLAIFATACHVIEHAHDWRLPIKLTNHKTQKELFLTHDLRVIHLDRVRDSASIIVAAADLDLPSTGPALIAAGQYTNIGYEVGWTGYPSIAAPNLCFFTGRISAYLHGKDSYLVDGVAINGVSGGPVFRLESETDHSPRILGTVSAYVSNRVGGNTLPGLLRVQDVTSFHESIQTIKSIDDAREQQEEKERSEKAAAAGSPAPTRPDKPSGSQAA